MSTPEGDAPPRALVFAAVVGAVLGYVGGAIVVTASLGAWSEALKRYAYMLQGGGGEGTYWGEPLFYAFMLTVVPNAANLGGAMVGAAAAVGLARAVAAAGGMVAFLRRYAALLATIWLLAAGIAFWFVRAQWTRARAEVARYREATQPHPIVWTPPTAATLERMRQECEAGRGGVCTGLGEMYRLAQGVPQDLGRALENYRKGCDKGFPPACHRLGVMYERGEGVAVAAPQALAFYDRGCNRGHAPSCRDMGTLAQRGAPGTPPDLGRTKSLYEKACALGEGWSCFTAGLMHERGQGTPKDLAQAADFYGKSCDVHYGIGCQYLGDSYAHGEGVVRDGARGRALYAEAAALYGKACDDGDAFSCSALGTMYRLGQGVPANAGRAHTLTVRACRAGSLEACVAAGISPPASTTARP
jgi:TPR repeat protein